MLDDIRTGWGKYPPRTLISTSIMTSFTYQFDTPTYKGSSSFSTGLFIGGKFVNGSDGGTIEYVLIAVLDAL